MWLANARAQSWLTWVGTYPNYMVVCKILMNKRTEQLRSHYILMDLHAYIALDVCLKTAIG